MERETTAAQDLKSGNQPMVPYDVKTISNIAIPEGL
jgi:hypothetical protein